MTKSICHRPLRRVGLVAALPVSLAVWLCATLATANDGPPNIVFIMADDLGYGDVACLNPEGKIETPNLDRLAREGMIFTDAHSSSSVCTPTRYGVLTGRYNWRSRLERGVLFGYSPRLIEEGRMTVADLLRRHGYRTVCIGKWHLGMNWPLEGGGFANNAEDEDRVDFTQPIKNGPLAVGFDYFYGISASLDMPPYVYVENDRAVTVPTVITTKFGRRGLKAEGLEPEDVLGDLTDKAVETIARNAAAAKQGTPMFLYLPLTAPHTPIAPADAWRGKSGLNAYGDFVMEVDDVVGRVLAALDEHELADNTLVIFTSDNGCSPQANFDELATFGHDPSHEFRGHKADIYEGGHRVPFLVRWPAGVAAGRESDQLLCLTDLMATCADILEVHLPDDAGEDSVSILPALAGEEADPARMAVVHHSIRGAFAIRRGDWKLSLCPGSGGWSAPRPGRDDLRGQPAVQLFNLSADIEEEHNRQADEPAIVDELTTLLQRYVEAGRSTPGAEQGNNREIDIRAAGRDATEFVPRQQTRRRAAKGRPTRG